MSISLKVEYLTGEINSILASVAAAASSWLSPVPEAAMTATAIQKIFELNGVLSWFIAASIELVGVSVNAHYLDVLTFNEQEEQYKIRYNRKTHRNQLEDAKSAKIYVATFYVVTGVIVVATAVYEVIAEHAAPIKLLAALFPIASAIGTITMNRRAALHRKQANIKQDKSEPERIEAETLPVENEPKQIGPLLFPFVCDVCEQDFATQNGLNAHKRKHNKVKRGNGHKVLELVKE